MKRISDFLYSTLEKVDIRLMIFVLLCLNFLSFTLSTNEEAYLPLAKQFMDPGWIPNSFTFTEWPGNRLLFQAIAGWALKYLTFEQVAFWGRLIVFLIIAFPFGKLFKILQIGNLPALIIIQIYLIKQNFFAGEFIFGDFEPKSLAYIMVFAGLNCLLNRKYIVAALCAVPAAYFHILAGGWFFFMVLIYTFFAKKDIKILLKQFLVFSILMAPFAVYLSKEILANGCIIQGINIDKVYVFFRNPHHTAPLSVSEHLLRTIFHITVTAILFGLTLFVFSKKKGLFFNELYLLNIIIFALLFASLGISLIDHSGAFLKFYPFRLAALGLFLMYLYVYKIIETEWSSPPQAKMIMILFGLYLLTAASLSTIKNVSHPEAKPTFEALVEYVTSQTEPDAVILPLEDYDLSFSRRTRREVFIIFKFDPGGGPKIYEWFHRIRERKKLLQNTGYIEQISKDYPLDYLLSDHPLPYNKRLVLVYQNTDYYLYKIQ